MKLLGALDLSQATLPVVDVCRRVAKRMHAEVFLLHVADPDPDFVGYEAGPGVVRDHIARKFRHEHHTLQNHADRLRQAGVNATALMIQGPAIETTLNEAERLNIDLIIVGSHGRSALFDIIAGSVSMGILRKSVVPVLVVPTRKK